MSTKGRSRIADSNNSVSECLKKVLAIAESYPDLEANDSFVNVQELAETEDLLAYARQYYNDVALDFNNHLQILPFSVFAWIFKFECGNIFPMDNHQKANQEQWLPIQRNEKAFLVPDPRICYLPQGLEQD